jgi:hypothetical protein
MPVSLLPEDAIKPESELGKKIANLIQQDVGPIKSFYVNPTGDPAHIVINDDIHYNLVQARGHSKNGAVGIGSALDIAVWSILTDEQKAALSNANPKLARQLGSIAAAPGRDDALKRLHWDGFFHTPETIQPRIKAQRSDEDLIEGLIPRRSIVVLVADSGLGKTPFQYQQAFCIASGIDFLGHPTRRGRVFIVDYENGLVQMQAMLGQFAQYYNLPLPNDNLVLFDANDAPPEWESPGFTLIDAINYIKPDITFIDSLGSAFPDMESKNEIANAKFKQLRQVIAATGTSVQLLLHPPKQSSRRPEDQPERLEGGNLSKWFHHNTRGARALINTPDVRLGIEKHSHGGLLLRGFRRVVGEIPQIFVKRKLEADGKTPLAYEQVSDAGLLFNPEQEDAFKKLPNEFTFKVAVHTYGKADQPTKNWLEKCIDIGLLQQPVQRGPYFKTQAGSGVTGVGK